MKRLLYNDHMTAEELIELITADESDYDRGYRDGHEAGYKAAHEAIMNIIIRVLEEIKP